MKKNFIKLVMMLFVLGMSTSAVWAGSYNTALRTMVDDTDTGKGLVYANTSNTASVTDNSYSNEVKSGNVQGSNGANQNLYGWAKPARGYVFSKWVSYDYDGVHDADQEIGCTPQANTGTADLILVRSWGGNAGNDVCGTAKASWNSATSYTVVYKQPIGGTYSVQYSYLTVNSSNKFATSNENATLSPSSEDWTPTGVSADQEGLSYAADVVTLTSNETSFDGWYENGVKISDGAGANHAYTYPVTKNANVTALFKWIEPVAPEEKYIRTTNNSANVNESVVFPMDNVVANWAAADFSVTLVGATGSGSFTLGSCSYNATDNELTVNFTYNANSKWDEGSSVNIQVAPSNASYGTSASVLVKAIAQQNSPYQARVSGDGFAAQEGDLTAMLAVANAHTDATLTLLNSVAVSEPLVITKSMTLDLNNWVLSSTAANKIISVEGTDTKLTISDNSFLQGGEIQLTRSANAAIAAIEVTGANRLLYNKGKMTVVNEASISSNTDAKAYGIYVSGTGNAVMQGGAISVTSDQHARGVYIASGFATLNVGKIEAIANSYAYALYSEGKINVAEGVSLTAITTSHNEAVALYLNAGTAVVDNVKLTATSANIYAYGAKVSGGKLMLNGGTIEATAEVSDACGVYITSTGDVTIQQQANIVAQVTDANGVSAYGIQNLGKLTLKNSSITAMSPAAYATAVESKTSATNTTIEGGTYIAQSATGYAYGLHHQHGTLNVDGGTFSAISAGDNVYGARATVDGAIANATLLAETTGSAKKAYGFVGAEENKNIALTNCIIKAKSATSAAYGIYSRANVTATGCTLEAKTLNGATANGFYAENDTNILNNTDATVESFTTSAYGVNYVAGTLTVNGGTFDVNARQATASALADSEVYGVKVADGKTANLSNAVFTVRGSSSSNSRNAYGVYTGTGTINSTACTYTVSASQKAYGVYGAASSNLTLRDNIISASTTATVTAYGIYSNSTFSINGDRVTSDTKSYDSYPLCFGASAVGTVQSGWFKALGTPGNTTQSVAPINKTANAANVKVQGGFFNDNVQLRYYVPTGYEIFGVDPNVTEYAQGYYYTVNDHLPYENVCYITEKNVGFPTLAEAFDYARNHSGSTYNIIMTQPYILPAGNYTLPSNATLVVPDRASRTTAIGTKAERQFPDQDQIRENRCLTFAEGVNLDVYGMIEVSAKQYTTNVGRIAYVLGPYGRIHLQEGSTVTLNSGAKINAWGYITGQGEIRVKNGAEVREFFQIHDMKAASAVPDWTSSANKNTYKAFLMNQYYIQSIEAPTKYYYGGKLIGSLSITSNATAYASQNADNVQLVATSDAFFTVDTDDESAWVRKSYNPTTDRILWETNSSASLGSIAVDGLGSYSFDSKDYTLPFTNNMTIHALSGIFYITQSTVLLPGSEIIIDKTATLNVNEKDVKGNDMGLYLYDKSQWSTAATPVMYSPSWTNGVCPRNTAASSMKDAAIYVKGKITVESALYTTAGGAAIYSDDANAGTIEFTANAAADGNLYQKYDGSGAVAVTAAKLRNGGETGPDANMTITKGVAEEGDTYAYANIDGTGFKWTRLKDVDGCIIADMTDPSNPVYFAKPQGYVAITSNEPDENHLFYSVAGSRLFIQQWMEAGCVWWEVTATTTPGVYHCATNDTYYEWTWFDEDNHDLGQGWVEVKRKVTFYFTDPKSEDANKKKVLTVNYGAKPDASIVSNPSKAEDAAATYQFYGWKSSVTGTEYAYTAELETVTENGTYYLPVFTSITKKYTITLKDAKNGADVPVEVFYGSVPEYTATKAATAEYSYTFDHWEPALQAVTGAATYTAYWTSVKNRYNITWVDGETTLEEDKNQLYGTATAFNGESLPTKETDDNYVYAFSGWKSSLTGATYANGSTPTVGGHTTYTAQYTTTPRYAITFANYDGTELQKGSVTQGEHPVYDEYKNGTPARVRDYDGYYKFTGWKNLSGTFYAKNATLPAATAKETYTAQYEYVTELYLITLRNVKGQGAAEGDNIWSGKFGVGSTPFYDPNGDDIADIPAKTGNAQYSYAFNGWSLTQDGAKIDPMPEVSGVATYWALFTQSVNKYTITFANVDGNGASEEIEVEYGTLPVCPVTPAKGDNNYTYAFLGWDQTIVAVTGDATYTAQFSSTGTPRTYTITFEPENGSAAQVLQVAYGTMPSPTIPSKASDAQYTYTFDSWYPALEYVTEDATYYAQYTQTLNSYTITFKDWNGTTLKSSSLQYGETPTCSTPSRPIDLENLKAYTFTGWSPAITTVTGNATYTAQYSETSVVASVTTSASVTTYYNSFGDAFSAANGSAGSTIKLYTNVTESNNTTRSLSKNMTIDLNGHTISAKNTNTTKYYIYINGAYTLTVNDSRGGGKIYFEGTGNTNYYAVDVHSGSGVLTVNGGTIEAKNTYNGTSVHAAVAQVYNSNSTVNVYGGELIASATRGKSYVVKHDGSSYGKLFVYGGKLKAGTDIVGDATASRNTLSGGYYSKDPGTNVTIASGKAKLSVRDDDPNGVSPAEYPYKVAPAHTITFKNWDNTNIQSGASEDGLSPLKPADPTRATTEGRVYTFTGWKNAGETFFAKDEVLPVVNADAVYTAQYKVDIEAQADEDEVVISENTTVETTTVRVSGRLKVNEGITLTTNDLILEATSNASGQLDAPTNTNIVAEHVYFDWMPNGTIGTENRTWYAIAVPWEVDAVNGIYCKEMDRHLVLGQDFDLIYYNGSTRAEQGDNPLCWDYVEFQTDKIMHPGRLYMMYFKPGYETIRFTKKSDADIFYGSKIYVYEYAGSAMDANWNGIANPRTYYASLTAGSAMYAQVLNNGNLDDYFAHSANPVYKTIRLNESSFTVGKPMFVQAVSAAEVAVTKADAANIVFNAPRRQVTAANLPEGITAVYRLAVAGEGEPEADNLFAQVAADDKEDRYTIGQDLVKGGVAAGRAQVWVNRYNAKLSVNTQSLTDGEATYPLTIVIPSNGVYELSVQTTTNEDQTLYLTKDGVAIWNLTNGAYTGTFEAGTTNSYGLRVAAKAPQITTGIDEAVVDAQGEIRKVLVNDKVFIIRGEHVYSTDGQLVK